MNKTKARYSPTEYIGINATERVILNDFHWIFRPQPICDMGIDAHVERADKGKPTGKKIELQIKTGSSHFKKYEDGLVFYGENVHLEYWTNHSNPVVLVGHLPDTGKTYWVKITNEHIEKTPKAWKIKIPYSQELNSKALNEFITITESSPVSSISQQISSVNEGPESRGIYGRQSDINKIISCLSSKTIVTLYGMSGIGKTALINEVIISNVFKKYGTLRLTAYPGMKFPEIYRQVAPALGCRDENPTPPIRLFNREIDFTNFARFAGKSPPFIIHVSQAHNLYNNRKFHDLDLLDFFSAIAQYAPNVKVILECREIPPENSLPAKLNKTIKIIGLNQESLKDYFHRPFVKEPKKGWNLTAEEAGVICHRLSDKDKKSQRAHPLGMFLLASVADGMNSTPIKVLERHEDSLRDKLEENLFQDLYDKVLSSSERHVLRLCALYREEIPDEHTDNLNELAKNINAFDHFVRRCLLTPDETQEKYYLHRLIALLTKNRIDKKNNEFFSNHECIANAWLHKVKYAKRISLPRMRAASEAIYHLTEAKSFYRLQEISERWIRTDIISHLVKVSSRLNSEGRKKDNLHVLNLIVAIDPDNHAGHRFLGGAIEAIKGRGNDEALKHYEKAYNFRPEFPPYLASLGHCLLSRGEPQIFLEIVDNLESRIRQEVMNGYNYAIYTQCLSKLDQKEHASKIRQEKIAEGIRHASIYTDEAVYLRNKGQLFEAMAILDKAESLCVSNEHTEFTRVTILHKKGDNAEASKISQSHIKARSKQPAFYCEEAKYLCSTGKLEDALNIILQAKKNGAISEDTHFTHIDILKKKGKNEDASKIRRSQIKSRSRIVAFYIDEAVYLRDLKKFSEAFAVLDDAHQLGISNEYSLSVRASILEKKGDKTSASDIRQKMIEAGTKDSVFYSDEAKYLSDQGKHDDALDLINLAENNKISNDYALAIKARILGKIGKKKEASSIRIKQIALNSQNPAFYTDEAEYLLQQSKYDKALEILDQAESIGANNEYTKSVRAKILDQKGHRKEASDIRTRQIKSGSLNPIFYNDEAVRLRDTGKTEKALKLLDAAANLNAINNYSITIRASILEKMGNGKMASDLRQKHIRAKLRHSALYNDEAVYFLNLGMLNEALSVLDEANKIGISDDHNLSIRASILEKNGDVTAASNLRQSKIKSGTLDPVFFNDEAVSLRNIEKFDEALEILELANIKNVGNQNTNSIRASILKKKKAYLGRDKHK